MKNLVTLRLYVRDPMDPETTTPIGTVDIPTAGEANLILSRNEIGTIFLESASVHEDQELSILLADATAALTRLHELMGSYQIASQHALTDMFAVHKWLTR